MTPEEWLAYVDPFSMLEFLRGTASDRKLRLLACACARRVFASEGIPEEIKVSERFADGQVDAKRLQAIRSRLGGVGGYSSDWAASNALSAVLSDSAVDAASSAVQYAATFVHYAAREQQRRSGSVDPPAALAAEAVERQAIADVVRDIFGNPVRPARVDPSWLTWNDSVVVTLAQRIYSDQDYPLLPMLADALEDAGCRDAEILGHCRLPGPHVRGCWIVDLLLGQK